MVRAFVLYEGEAPDAERYEQHNATSASKVPGATFRHGGVFGAADRRAASTSTTPSSSGRTWTRSRPATRSEEFAAAGKDAMEMGIPFNVLFVDVS